MVVDVVVADDSLRIVPRGRTGSVTAVDTSGLGGKTSQPPTPTAAPETPLLTGAAGQGGVFFPGAAVGGSAGAGVGVAAGFVTNLRRTVSTNSGDGDGSAFPPTRGGVRSLGPVRVPRGSRLANESGLPAQPSARSRPALVVDTSDDSSGSEALATDRDGDGSLSARPRHSRVGSHGIGGADGRQQTHGRSGGLGASRFATAVTTGDRGGGGGGGSRRLDLSRLANSGGGEWDGDDGDDDLTTARSTRTDSDGDMPGRSSSRPVSAARARAAVDRRPDISLTQL